jgi:hypothetical protein
MTEGVVNSLAEVFHDRKRENCLSFFYSFASYRAGSIFRLQPSSGIRLRIDSMYVRKPVLRRGRVCDGRLYVWSVAKMRVCRNVG